MTNRKNSRSTGSSAYRIKRAKVKKPLRFLEVIILLLFILVVGYAVSFTVQITKGYSQEEPPTTHYIRLQVLNGCGIPGLANRLITRIEGAVSTPLVVQIIETENFERFDIEKTFIVSRKSDLTAATMLAQQLGLDPAVAYRELENNYMDIGATLVLGKDYQAMFTVKPSAGK
jgi:hypothetical protein